MSIKFVGIDLAKSVFQLCGLTQGGKVVFEKRVQRKGLLEVVAQLPSCVIGVEACTGAFYWQREFEMNITKRGDQHLRTLLVHGARAVVRTAGNQQGYFNQWVNQLKDRRGYNKAIVAVANKNARIIWAVLRHGSEYRGSAT